MRRAIGIGCLIFLLANVAPSAWADAPLTIHIQNTTVAPGGTGMLNIYLSTTDQGATFNDDQFQFQITAAPGHVLEFAPNSETRLRLMITWGIRITFFPETAHRAASARLADQ
jgi:hypothetical protein